MAQDTLLTNEVDAGRQLIARLHGVGFDVNLAFWLNETDSGRWFLYLASPLVDVQGPAAAYRIVLPIIESAPELGIDPFAVKVVGVDDSMAAAAREVLSPRLFQNPLTQSPRLHSGMIRFGGSELAGVSIDGAYIYSPYQPAA